MQTRSFVYSSSPSQEASSDFRERQISIFGHEFYGNLFVLAHSGTYFKDSATIISISIDICAMLSRNVDFLRDCCAYQ